MVSEWDVEPDPFPSLSPSRLIRAGSESTCVRSRQIIKTRESSNSRRHPREKGNARMVYESQISFTLDTICPWCVPLPDGWKRL